MTKMTTSPIILIMMVFLIAGCAATNERRSTGEVVDDSAIATRVKSALLADQLTDGLDIEIEVDRGRVQLIGFADSAAERQRAGEIAARIGGVTAVSNNLQIAEQRRRVGEYIDDKVLVAKANTALARHPGVSALAIEVEVNRGIVTLGGFVDTAAEQAAANDALQGITGIREVVNDIAVR